MKEPDENSKNIALKPQSFDRLNRRMMSSSKWDLASCLTMMASLDIAHSWTESTTAADGKATKCYVVSKKDCSTLGEDSGYSSASHTEIFSMHMKSSGMRQSNFGHAQDRTLLATAGLIFTPGDSLTATIRKEESDTENADGDVAKRSIDESYNEIYEDQCDSETWLLRHKSITTLEKLRCDCAPEDLLGLGTQFNQSKAFYVSKKPRNSEEQTNKLDSEIAFFKSVSTDSTHVPALLLLNGEEQDASELIQVPKNEKEGVSNHLHDVEVWGKDRGAQKTCINGQQMSSSLAIPLSGRHVRSHTLSSGTCGGSSSGQAFPSTSGSTNAFLSGTRSCLPDKRKLDKNDDGDEDEGQRGPPNGQGCPEWVDSVLAFEEPLACPFDKLCQYYPQSSPTLSYSSTCKRKFKDTGDIKQHLKEVHYFGGIYCRRCLDKFKTESNLTRHQRSPKGCELKTDEAVEMSLPGREQRKRFDELGKKPRGGRNEPRWETIWKALFPTLLPPSPYWEGRSISEDDISNNVVSNEANQGTAYPNIRNSSESGTSYPPSNVDAIGGRGLSLYDNLDENLTGVGGQNQSSIYTDGLPQAGTVQSNSFSSALGSVANFEPVQSISNTRTSLQSRNDPTVPLGQTRRTHYLFPDGFQSVESIQDQRSSQRNDFGKRRESGHGVPAFGLQFQTQLQSQSLISPSITSTSAQSPLNQVFQFGGGSASWPTSAAGYQANTGQIAPQRSNFRPPSQYPEVPYVHNGNGLAPNFSTTFPFYGDHHLNHVGEPRYELQHHSHRSQGNTEIDHRPNFFNAAAFTQNQPYAHNGARYGPDHGQFAPGQLNRSGTTSRVRSQHDPARRPVPGPRSAASYEDDSSHHYTPATNRKNSEDRA